MKRPYPTDPAEQETFRQTDPGMFIVDDEVVWDGEAEATDTPSKVPDAGSGAVS